MPRPIPRLYSRSHISDIARTKTGHRRSSRSLAARCTTVYVRPRCPNSGRRSRPLPMNVVPQQRTLRREPTQPGWSPSPSATLSRGLPSRSRSSTGAYSWGEDRPRPYFFVPLFTRAPGRFILRTPDAGSRIIRAFRGPRASSRPISLERRSQYLIVPNRFAGSWFVHCRY